MRALLWIVITLVALVGLTALIAWLSGERAQPNPDDLPWRVQILEDGGTRVFGVTLGRTPLAEFAAARRAVPEYAVFRMDDGALSAEAYFGRLRLGYLDARIIMTLGLPGETLKAWVAERPAGEPMPSGAWRYELTEQEIARARAAPVIAITYVPLADYEPATVRQRFGEPTEVLPIDATQRYWLYPEQGLIMLLADEGREALEYVAPQAFEAAVQRARARVLSHAEARG
jgi:hypothetical protein